MTCVDFMLSIFSCNNSVCRKEEEIGSSQVSNKRVKVLEDCVTSFSSFSTAAVKNFDY